MAEGVKDGAGAARRELVEHELGPPPRSLSLNGSLARAANSSTLLAGVLVNALFSEPGRRWQ